MSEYVCVGIVQMKGNVKGVRYFRVKDGTIDESDCLLFDRNRRTDNPVGWVMDIKKGKGKDTYQFGEMVKILNGETAFEEQLVKYRLESASNVKKIELEQLRERGTKIRAQLESMTLGEIRTWADKSYANKQALRFYLMELY